jgi:basic amino acid/polyamine antiporter, APA family
VLVVAAFYLVALLGVQLTVPQGQLAESSAPFADAARVLTGAGWVADAISVVALISAVGALNGWTVVNGEMVVTASRDGMFPPATAVVSSRGVPVRAIVGNSVLATALVLANQAGDFIGLFTTLALLSTFAYVFTYVLSMAAQLMWLAQGKGDPATAARDGVIALLAVGFGIWMIGATGEDTVFAGVLMLLVGIPVYVAEAWRRRRSDSSMRASLIDA